MSGIMDENRRKDVLPHELYNRFALNGAKNKKNIWSHKFGKMN